MGWATAPFADRADAGRCLARRLEHLRGKDLVVLGLPRGGVPVAFEVAAALGAPLDVIVVRKLGVPFRPELAMGAVGEDGALVVNRDVLTHTGVTPSALAEAERRERAEVADRAVRFRPHRSRLPLTGRTALIVDDGIATGATARAACQVARAHGAARVVLAVPVCSPRTAEELRGEVDEFVVVDTPARFAAVGQAYVNFRPVPDEEVLALLRRADAGTSGVRPDPDGTPARAALRDEEVAVAVGDVDLTGHLTVPDGAAGVVVFVHGSGSSRHSPRNRYVARVLQEAGLATLLFDLLTIEEERERARVFDIALLAGRLVLVTGWVREQPECRSLPVGWFGASTGAGAALWAAAERDADVAAVVSRGGRPDLAAPRLGAVRAPTLLVVGGADRAVLDLNEQAAARLRCEHRLAVVPGASHLFEEPGTLETAAGLARDWFLVHLAAARQPDVPGRSAVPEQ